jgi:hypothetical protein
VPGERDRTADQVEGGEGGQEWEVHVGGDDVPSISKHHPYSSEEKSAVVASSVADQGCLSRIRILSIPDQKDYGSRIRIKEFKYFNPKNCF